MVTRRRVPSRELRARRRPKFESGKDAFRLVDLFSGCGGLSLGTAQAVRKAERALDVRLAVEIETNVAEVYERNFPNVRTMYAGSVLDLFQVGLSEDISSEESTLAGRIGTVDLLVGGPPCQGHSNLNNHTRRDDPKNALYLVMARAARVLRPAYVLVENVPSVLNDRYQGRNVVRTATEELHRLGYEVSDGVVSMLGLGVAQRRSRHILLASRVQTVSPSRVIESARSAGEGWRVPTVRDAIGDLDGLESLEEFDRPSKASSENRTRMKYLMQSGDYDLPNELRPLCHRGTHSYKSMYGRLAWDSPAQTITSGFGSMGQGRYVHPTQERVITPHEAARLQGFPDYFDFRPAPTRSAMAKMIGNAVPPQLARFIVGELLGDLPE